MHSLHLVFSLVIGVSLAGCTVLPSVQYRPIDSEESMQGMTDAYFLAQSEIEVSVKPAATSGTGAQKARVEVGISSTPVHSDNKLGIRAITNWRSSTVVNISKKENTDLVKSIGVEVTDNTAKNIAAYGGAIVKVFGLVATADEAAPCITEDKPVKFFVVPRGSEAETKRFRGSDGTTECIQVMVGERPKGTIEFSKLRKDEDSHNFYYSACREVEVTVNLGGTRQASRKVRIAEPSYLQYVQFPPKGSITTHSECGVSVVTEAAAADNGAAIVDALATQAKAIKDAIDASRK